MMLDRSNVRAVVATCLSVLLLTSTARGGNWPTPAAGSSVSGDPEVVLTFDDGPHPRATIKVLDILAARKLQAIFFMTGDHFEGELASRSRGLLARALGDGHVIASHTMTHPNLCAGKPEVAASEIDRSRAVLEREARMSVAWFRAPYGAWCPRLVEQLGSRQITHFYWDIDPQEWRTGSAKLTEWKVTRALKRLRGRAMLLMHDTKAATVKALPKILEWIDAENARRAKTGHRPIRIVSGPQYAAELLGADAIAEARSLANDALAVLAGGVASALP